jgi:hypothetical protein
MAKDKEINLATLDAKIEQMGETLRGQSHSGESLYAMS